MDATGSGPDAEAFSPTTGLNSEKRTITSRGVVSRYTERCHRAGLSEPRARICRATRIGLSARARKTMRSYVRISSCTGLTMATNCANGLTPPRANWRLRPAVRLRVIVADDDGSCSIAQSAAAAPVASCTESMTGDAVAVGGTGRRPTAIGLLTIHGNGRSPGAVGSHTQAP